MIVLLSPAKNLKEVKDFNTNLSTMPVMMDDSIRLMSKLKKLSSRQIKSLMKISADLAQLNYERNQEWDEDFNQNNATPAILTFAGEVYRGMGADTFSEKDMKYAQEKLRILSGLHGLLRPLDLIKPYRLEMGSKLKITKNVNNLYKFWSNRLTNEVNNLIDKDGEHYIVNLASNEYYKALDENQLKVPVIHTAFKDWKNGQYKSIMTYAKLARGMMASYIIRNRVESIEQLKMFDDDGYQYNDKLSEENNFVFTRE